MQLAHSFSLGWMLHLGAQHLVAGLWHGASWADTVHRNYRDRKLLDTAYQFPCMLNFPCCEGGDAGEPAHSNQYKHGKGGAMKAHDCFFVPACRACHVYLDQGGGMTKEERRSAWEDAYWRFVPMAFDSGLWKAK